MQPKTPTLPRPPTPKSETWVTRVTWVTRSTRARSPASSLDQNVVRRLLTTLMHDLYMLRIVDPLDLCCATYLNLHGLKEARGTYNCLEAMFVD